MKNFKKGISLIAVIAFLITAILPISGLAAESSNEEDYQVSAKSPANASFTVKRTANAATSGAPDYGIQPWANTFYVNDTLTLSVTEAEESTNFNWTFTGPKGANIVKPSGGNSSAASNTVEFCALTPGAYTVTAVEAAATRATGDRYTTTLNINWRGFIQEAMPNGPTFGQYHANDDVTANAASAPAPTLQYNLASDNNSSAEKTIGPGVDEGDVLVGWFFSDEPFPGSQINPSTGFPYGTPATDNPDLRIDGGNMWTFTQKQQTAKEPVVDTYPAAAGTNAIDTWLENAKPLTLTTDGASGSSLRAAGGQTPNAHPTVKDIVQGAGLTAGANGAAKVYYVAAEVKGSFAAGGASRAGDTSNEVDLVACWPIQVSGVAADKDLTISLPEGYSASKPFVGTLTVTDENGNTIATLANGATANLSPVKVAPGASLTVTYNPGTTGYALTGLEAEGAPTLKQDETDKNVWTFTMPATAVGLKPTIAAAETSIIRLPALNPSRGELRVTVNGTTTTSGTEAVSTSAVAQNTPVTVEYIQPSDGSYNLTQITLAQSNGSPISGLTSPLELVDGKASFSMPAAAVYISAVPRAVAKPTLTIANPAAGTFTVTDPMGNAYPSGQKLTEGTEYTLTYNKQAGYVLSAGPTITYAPGTGSIEPAQVSGQENTWTFVVPAAASESITIAGTSAAAQKATLTYTNLTASGNPSVITDEKGSFTVTADGVSVPDGGEVAQGALVTVQWNGKNNWNVATLTASPDSVKPANTDAASNTYTFTMPATAVTLDCTLSQAMNLYTATAVQPGANMGTLSVSAGTNPAAATTTAVEKQTVTVTYAPFGDYQALTPPQFKTDVASGDCIPVPGQPNTWTFTMPAANTNVTITPQEVVSSALNFANPNGGTLSVSTVDADGNASEIKTGDLVAENTTVRVEFAPTADSGFMLDSVTYNNNPAVKTANPNVYTFRMPGTETTVAAQTSRAAGNFITVTDPEATPPGSQGTLAVTIDGEPVDVSDTSTQRILPNTEVTVTYTPPTDGSYIIDDVVVTTTGASPENQPVEQSAQDKNVWTFYMPNAPVNVTAEVQQVRSARVIFANPGNPPGSEGTIKVSADGSDLTSGATVKGGTEVTVTYQSAPGYTIGNVALSGGLAATQDENNPNVWTFTMPNTGSSVTITANAVTATPYGLTVSPMASGTGTLTVEAAGATYRDGTHDVAQNTLMTVTYAPTGSYKAATLKVVYTDSPTIELNPAPVQSETNPNEWTFAMPAQDVTVSAEAVTLYSVTTVATPTAGGKLDAEPSEAAAGEQITVTATPADGYELESITASGASVTLTGDGNTRTFTMPTSNVTVTATFKAIPAEFKVTVTPSVIATGETATAAALNAPEGSTVTWTSDNDAIATVSSTGEVTGVAEGTATITGTAGDQTASAKVTVSSDKTEPPANIPEDELTTITENQGTLSLPVLVDEDGNDVKLDPDAEYTYVVSFDGTQLGSGEYKPGEAGEFDTAPVANELDLESLIDVEVLKDGDPVGFIQYPANIVSFDWGNFDQTTGNPDDSGIQGRSGSPDFTLRGEIGGSVAISGTITANSLPLTTSPNTQTPPQFSTRAGVYDIVAAEGNPEGAPDPSTFTLEVTRNEDPATSASYSRRLTLTVPADQLTTADSYNYNITWTRNGGSPQPILPVVINVVEPDIPAGDVAWNVAVSATGIEKVQVTPEGGAASETSPVTGVAPGTKVAVEVTTAAGVTPTITGLIGVSDLTLTEGANNVWSGSFTMPAEGGVQFTVNQETVTPGTYEISITAPTNGTVSTDPANAAAAGTEVAITATPATGYQVGTITVTNADDETVTVTDGKFTMPASNVTVAVTFTAKAGVVTFVPATGTQLIAAGGPGTLVRALVKNAEGKDVLAEGTWSAPAGTELKDFGIANATENPITIIPDAKLASPTEARTYTLTFTTANGSSTFTFTIPATGSQNTFAITEQEVNEYGNGQNATGAAADFVPGSYVTVLQGSTSSNPSLRVIVRGPSSADQLAATRFFWSANEDQLTLKHMQDELLSESHTPNESGVNLCPGKYEPDGTGDITIKNVGTNLWAVTYQLTDKDVANIVANTSGPVTYTRAGKLQYVAYRALVPAWNGTTAENVAAALASPMFYASYATSSSLTLRTTQSDSDTLYVPGTQVALEGLWAPQPAAAPTAPAPVWTLQSTTAPAGSIIRVSGSPIDPTTNPGDAATLSGNYPQTLTVTDNGTGMNSSPFDLYLTNLPEGSYTFGLSAGGKTAQIKIQVTAINVGSGAWATQASAGAPSGVLPTYEAGAAGWDASVPHVVKVATNGRFTIHVPVTDAFGNKIVSRSLSKVWEFRTSADQGGANGITIPAGNGFYGVNAEQLRSGPVTADMNGWQFRLVAQATDNPNYQAVSDWYTINVTDAGAVAEVPQVTVTSAPESSASVVTATQTADVTFTADVQNSIAGNDLSYQWQSRAAATAAAPNPQWTNIQGANAKTYTLSNISSALEGTQYRCVVTNNAFSTGINGDSNALTLKVNTQAGAIIISSPAAASLRNLYSSRTADFAVTARTDNGDPVTYQWFVKGVPGPVLGGNVTSVAEAAAYLANAPVTAVTGANTASYTTQPLEEGVYEYVCRVANENNSSLTQNSAGFYLVVTKLSRVPQITSPAPGTTKLVGTPAGQSYTFECKAHVQSQETLTYQWQASQNGATGWADLPNQTGANFILPNPAGENSGWYYRCVVTNAAAGETSTSGSYRLTVWNTADVPVVGAINPQAWEGSLSAANEKGVTLTSSAAAPSGAAITAQWMFKPVGGDWGVAPSQPQPAQTWNGTTKQWESRYELPTDTVDKTNNNDIYSEEQAENLNGQYKCVWTNGTAGINDGVAGTGVAPVNETGACTVNIIVPGAPRITAQPADATAPVGSTATFAVGAILNPNPDASVQGTLVYVWQMSADGGDTWRNVLSTDASGQFTSSLSVPVTQTMYDNETAANILGKNHVYKYRVNVANRASGLNVYSDAVDLTVTPGSVSEPVITPGADSPIKIEGTGADKVATGVTGTKDGMTVKDYLDTLGYTAPAGYTLRIVNAEGEAVAEDAIVCTGYKLELIKDSDNTVVDSATIIITGDVLGTGQINIAQLVRMARDLNGVEALTGVYLQAGDFNGTGNIDIADLVAEARIINETIDIM